MKKIVKWSICGFLSIPLGISAQPKINSKAPELTLEAVYNKADNIIPHLVDLKGNIVILDFWATWCLPCVAAFPKNNRLYEKYRDKGLKFIAISDEPKYKLEKFIQKVKPTFWIGQDHDRNDFLNYGVQSLPTVVVINGAGDIVYTGNEINEKIIDDVIAGKTSGIIEKNLPVSYRKYVGFSPGDDPIDNAMLTLLNSGKFTNKKPIYQKILRESIFPEMNSFGWNLSKDGEIGYTQIGGTLSEIFTYIKKLPSKLWIINNSSNTSKYDVIYYKRNAVDLEKAFDEISKWITNELNIKVDTVTKEQAVIMLNTANRNPFIKNEKDISISDPTYKTYISIDEVLQNFEKASNKYVLAGKSLNNILIDGLEFREKLNSANENEIITFLKNKGISLSQEKRIITTYIINNK